MDVKNIVEAFALVFLCSGQRPVFGCSEFGYELPVIPVIPVIAVMPVSITFCALLNM